MKIVPTQRTCKCGAIGYVEIDGRILCLDCFNGAKKDYESKCNDIGNEVGTIGNPD